MSPLAKLTPEERAQADDDMVMYGRCVILEQDGKAELLPPYAVALPPPLPTD